MKLTALDSTFVGGASPDGKSFYRLPSSAGAQGVLFQCPKCAAGKPVCEGEHGGTAFAGAHYVLVWFSNPRDAVAVDPTALPGPYRWAFSGDTLDTLTLTPSIDLSKHEGSDHTCDWHGHVMNGYAA